MKLSLHPTTTRKNTKSMQHENIKKAFTSFELFAIELWAQEKGTRYNGDNGNTCLCPSAIPHLSSTALLTCKPLPVWECLSRLVYNSFPLSSRKCLQTPSVI
jgi:hypothetical protein